MNFHVTEILRNLAVIKTECSMLDGYGAQPGKGCSRQEGYWLHYGKWRIFTRVHLCYIDFNLLFCPSLENLSTSW